MSTCIYFSVRIKKNTYGHAHTRFTFLLLDLFLSGNPLATHSPVINHIDLTSLCFLRLFIFIVIGKYLFFFFSSFFHSSSFFVLLLHLSHNIVVDVVFVLLLVSSIVDHYLSTQRSIGMLKNVHY
jgi:hypothetical protein